MTADTSTLVAAYQPALTGNFSICAGVALGCYEYLITIKYEANFLCRRKWSAATWLFLANRYMIVAMMIYQIAPYPPQTCNSIVVNILSSLIYLHPVIAAVASSLRIFALLQRDSRCLQVLLSGVVLCLGISVSGSQIYESATIIHAYVDDPVFGPSCTALGSKASSAILLRLSIATAAETICSQTITLLVTWWKTFRQVREASSLGMKLSLSSTLLRDGSIFFLLSLIESIIVVCQQTTNFDDSFIMYLMVPIMFILQPILLSRFLIHLRQLDTHGGTDFSANTQPSHFSLPNFHMPTINDVVGNLGEPLNFSDEGDTCNVNTPEHIVGNEDIRIATLDSTEA